MSNALLVDSSYYIRCLREDSDPLPTLEAASEDWEIVTCGMVMTEVLRGFREEKVKRRFEQAMGCMLYVPTTNTIWESATKLAWELDRTGRILPATDILIAACALSRDAVVLTHDRHFSHIPKLHVTDRVP